MNIVYLDFRPFSNFVNNGFRQRAGRILHHLIHSDRVDRLVYIWWNQDAFAGVQGELPQGSEYKKVRLHNARRAAVPFARRLGLAGGWMDVSRIRKAVKACQELTEGSYWVLATDPRLVVPAREIADRLNGKVCVDLIDNFANRFGGEHGEVFQKAYADTLRLADKIMANNPSMQSYLNIPDARFRCVLNGVDWQVFHDAIHLPEPADIAGIARPRVGFVGTLGVLNDLNLLNAVATEIPECEVIVIGSNEDVEKYIHPRIHAFGLKPYNEVPAYISSFDVCVSIYRQHPSTQYGDSQKIKEYLAAGKPVVASRAPNNRTKSDYISWVDNAEEFVVMVRKALEKTGDINLKAREKISLSVADQDWQRRITEILDFLNEEVRI